MDPIEDSPPIHPPISSHPIPFSQFPASRLIKMPGAIRVTVLEFKGVSPSSKPSAKSLKVSMGKKEFQTWDKGEFSFPITKLTEDLVVALLDAAGDEIARSDIRTMRIIEKGLWDEVFSIDGCGHVHMKLQFVLSEEDRQRIRIMRESAVKKKLETNPNISNLRLSEASAETVKEIEQASDLDLAVHRKEEGTNLEDAIPDTTDGSSVASLSPSNEGIESESQPLADASSIDKETDTSYNLSGSGLSDSVASKPQHAPVQESRRMKVPSNVRKMISAFESCQVQLLQETERTDSIQETKALKKTPSIQSTLNKSRKELLSEDLGYKAGVSPANECKDLQEKNRPFLSEGNGSVKPNVEERQQVLADAVVESASATATRPRRLVAQDYEEASRTKSLESYEEECASAQSSGVWIFPDNVRRLCVTTAGDNHIMNVASQTSLERKISPEPPGQENVISATEHKMEKNQYEAVGLSESGRSHKPDDSSNGVVGKVIKLAAIFGFGLLVFLTRQKEPRKSSYRKKKSAAEFNKLLQANLL